MFGSDDDEAPEGIPQEKEDSGDVSSKLEGERQEIGAALEGGSGEPVEDEELGAGEELGLRPEERWNAEEVGSALGSLLRGGTKLYARLGPGLEVTFSEDKAEQMEDKLGDAWAPVLDRLVPGHSGAAVYFNCAMATGEVLGDAVEAVHKAEQEAEERTDPTLPDREEDAGDRIDAEMQGGGS